MVVWSLQGAVRYEKEKVPFTLKHNKQEIKAVLIVKVVSVFTED